MKIEHSGLTLLLHPKFQDTFSFVLRDPRAPIPTEMGYVMPVMKYFSMTRALPKGIAIVRKFFLHFLHLQFLTATCQNF